LPIEFRQLTAGLRAQPLRILGVLNCFLQASPWIVVITGMCCWNNKLLQITVV